MFIIDRFEGEWAILECEDRTTFDLPRRLLPHDAKEGDVVNIAVAIDQEATNNLRKENNNIFDNFFE